MAYSPHLTYFLDRLSGFSTNVFKLEPQSTGDAIGPNKISRFTLPSNALLNMRSFCVNFNATTTGNGARICAKIETLLERVEISAGGIQLSQGTNFYNTFSQAKQALMGNTCDATMGHPEICRTNTFDGNTILNGGYANETYDNSNNQTQFSINKWEGFLGTCEPSIIDAAILPDLVITLYWTSANVLTSSENNNTISNFTLAPINVSASANYVINNLHATIEVCGLADATYDNMVSAMISQKGFLEIPFKQYFSFQNTHTGSSRFTIATQCLDRLWFAWRNQDYGTITAPTVVPGYWDDEKVVVPTSGVSLAASGTPTAGIITITAGHKFEGEELVQYFSNGGTAITVAAAPPVPFIDGQLFRVQVLTTTTFKLLTIGNAAIDVFTGAGNNLQTFSDLYPQSKYGGQFNTNKEKYVGNYYKFTEPKAAGSTKITFQAQLNGAYYPQMAATSEQMYLISKNSIPGNKPNYEITLEQYKSHYFVQALRLNLPDSELSRQLSGLDTRSVSLNGYYLTNNLITDNTNQPNLTIFAECTSTLRVGSMRQLEVII